MADPNRFKLEGDDYYLKSPEEMRRVWRDLPEACDNTLLIAERCEVSFTEGEEDKLRAFVHQGGLIVGHADPLSDRPHAVLPPDYLSPVRSAGGRTSWGRARGRQGA